MKKKSFQLNDALLHPDHHRPKSRRDFIAQGLTAGAATVLGAPWLASSAQAEISEEILTGNNGACLLNYAGANKVPFICFDLAGGANIAGSNVLVGGAGGQKDFLSTAGYVKQGVPGDMSPAIATPLQDEGVSHDFINERLGLAFHADSQFLAGILERASAETLDNVDGAVIAARSENDTGNNPHNPMYGIYKAGAAGALLPLCGSSSSISGGNSMAPASMIDPSARPTKIDRATDVTGLINTGLDVDGLSNDDKVAILEAMYHISSAKLTKEQTKTARDDVIKQHVRCTYAKGADIVDRFGGVDLSPIVDPFITGSAEGTPSPIFTRDELLNDREFQKTASVMKLVLDGPVISRGSAGSNSDIDSNKTGAYAGAGTITMGGFDYHTGDRSTGERRDLRAGRCIGAVLEYARRKQKPVMIYVFSDGSVFSNGMTDDSEAGRGKGVWTGDNQQTASAFFLVYNPVAKPTLNTDLDVERARQVGFMRTSGDVETSSSPAANNVNLLVETVVMNYMALNGNHADFANVFQNQGLGNIDRLRVFEPLNWDPT